ncbi:dynein intermediate chain 4, axonemal [Teleopsis dalmanni]|uniref:dynein intermediate chain 4, axonemal n=1 Tax=Teleopsis dalmanni TaxID=139649 RepID=UPI0018CFD9E8|nr:dynein intermediate chain 4, axonemal [Teleopsis dalmanni]
MDEELAAKFKELHQKIRENELMKPDTAIVNTRRVKLSDLKGALSQINLNNYLLQITASDYKLDLNLNTKSAADTKTNDVQHVPKTRKPVNPYIKIVLRKTNLFVLYEQSSYTALRDTEEGKQVEQENEQYEALLKGRKKWRSTRNAETQTIGKLFKSREVNTETVKTDHVGVYVSNFEMFDTYKDMEKTTQSVDIDGEKTMEVTTYKLQGIDEFEDIGRKPNFNLAMMLTMRILAGNVYEKQQRRFRNMSMPDPLAENVEFKYRLELLWRFRSVSLKECGAVADMSWCPCNGDIIAVAYGIYGYKEELQQQSSKKGYICIWNIKNPVNPERCYNYNVPVMSVEFSTYRANLIAIGLYDGCVQIRNVMEPDLPPIAISKRNISPVVTLKWLPHIDGKTRQTPIEPILALFQEGLVKKYNVLNSVELFGSQQIRLNRVKGNTEGLSVERVTEQAQANQQPQGLNLSLDPTEPGIYYVLTDEGCIHKCSINNTTTNLHVLQAHHAGINGIDFSPWSPKLLLTYGNDWCIRVWLVGIYKPLITLQHKYLPVHSAKWSLTHSTIIVAVNQRTVDVWDIRRSTMRPASSTNIDPAFHTIFRFSKCGRSLALGNESGDTLMLSFEDMPFPAHFQYDVLESAIFQAIFMNKELTKIVKSMGFFGYPGKVFN